MSKDYAKEIGYESLQSDFKRYQKQTPRGVGMTKKGQNIYLQFKTPNSSRKPYACNCTFTLDGMVDALRKANLVSKALKTITSEVEFWDWYDKEIKNESQLVDDRVTFGKAIKKVEDDFWNRLSRTKRKRDKSNPSDQKSWYRKYGCFFKHLPSENLVNLKDILSVVNKQKIGSSNYGEVVGTMKKLAIVNQRRDICEALKALDTKQTIFMKLQNIDLEEFLEWRDKTLGITVTLSPRCNMEVRKAWLWVFSSQIVYALRISEVIAIENLFKPYVTEDRKTIPALNDPDNTTNLIVIGEYTILNTTTKTGYRIAATTHYFGSKGSKKLVRVYKHKNESLRLETQFRGKYAKKAFETIATLKRNDETDEEWSKIIYKTIGGIAIGTIDFRDKSKLRNKKKASKSKTKRLPFWEQFTNQIGEPILIRVPTAKTDMSNHQRSFNWLEKTASKTLAKAFHVLGENRFFDYLYRLIKVGESKFTPQDKKQIEYLQDNIEYLNFD